MTKIVLPHQVLVALYAYLRHLDLSLDRSRWGAWQDYVSYAHAQVAPAVIRRFLQPYYCGVTARTSSVVLPEESYVKLRLRYLVCTFLQRDNYLIEPEVAYIWQLLETYQRYLATAWDSYSSEVDQLRLRIARFCYTVLETKLSRREVHQLSLVEHYLSADHLQTVPLQPFLAVLE
jgi:hypothetical protein